LRTHAALPTRTAASRIDLHTTLARSIAWHSTLRATAAALRMRNGHSVEHFRFERIVPTCQRMGVAIGDQLLSGGELQHFAHLRSETHQVAAVQ
jgi:hypothetical protein